MTFASRINGRWRAAWSARTAILPTAAVALAPTSAHAGEASAAAPPSPPVPVGETSGHAGSHRITLAIGHSHASQGFVDDRRQWLVTPAWSLNYDFWLADRWAIGLQNDVIIESFVIEHDGVEKLERSYPVTTVPAVLYKPLEFLILVGGVGAEIAPSKTLVLTRLGTEFGVPLGDRGEVGAALFWDGKWGYYNSWVIAATVSGFLGGR